MVIPLWRRPEFLVIWIELMKKVKNADSLFYIFAIDWAGDHMNQVVIKEQFPFEYGIILTPKTGYTTTKQSYNVLNGLLSGAKRFDGLVFYLEEDVFPGIDFIDWHRGIHKREKDIFCSIATRNNNTKYPTIDDPDAYYLSSNPDYQALGSCFKSEILKEYVAPHMMETYFRNGVKYCMKNFPNSRIGQFYCEQDGLIRRIVEKEEMTIAFPHIPRAYHAGFYGYHRKLKVKKAISLDAKVELVREVAFSDDKMKEFSQHPNYYEDSKPVDLEIIGGDFKRIQPE